MRHNLKLNYRFAEPVYNGDKRFEIRNNDRAFQKGDEVKFTVIDDDGDQYKPRFDRGLGKSVPHPLENMVFEITYIISGCGLIYKHFENNLIIKILATVAVVFLGVGLLKTIIECQLYSIPFEIKIVKNLVATMIDSVAMIIGLCLYPQIKRHLGVKNGGSSNE